MGLAHHIVLDPGCRAVGYGGRRAVIYYELLREYKRHCSPEELETLLELDRITTPIEWPATSHYATYQPQGHGL